MNAAELLTAIPQPCYRVDLDGCALTLKLCELAEEVSGEMLAILAGLQVGETRTVVDLKGETHAVARTS